MKRVCLLCVGASLALFPASPAGNLYSTDFESFPVGDNQWAGSEGWISNDLTSGAQGILQDFVMGLPLGKTAYLGFERPNSAFTAVARPVNYNPALAGVPCIRFESLLGVQDSTNSQRDQFFVSFYDIGGSFLAAIVFDNTSANGDVLRWRGLADQSVESSNTGVPFIRGDQSFSFIALQLLSAQVDLANNTWSAQLDGIPLFTDAPFADPALVPLTLGSVAAEWELGLPSPALAGDNWLLVADWIVRTAPRGTEPFLTDPISRNESGHATITWPGDPGFDYHVEYSLDLKTWHRDLPNSTFPAITSPETLSFTDPESLSGRRFYRVGRAETP